jgi:hypothetical protein
MVFYKPGLESKGNNCFFIKIAKSITKKLSFHLEDRFDFGITEIITNNKYIQSLSVQNKKIYRFKTILIRRFLFNIIYLDDPEYALGLFS